jgi:hypothetical protein
MRHARVLPSLLLVISLAACSSSSNGAGSPDAGNGSFVDAAPDSSVVAAPDTSDSFDTADAAAGPWTVTPGVGVGPIHAGDTYAAVKALLGEATPVGFNRLVFGRWADRKLEVVFASAQETTISDDARVLAVGVQDGAVVTGTPHPGMTRAELVAALGAPSDEINQILYWPSGASALFDADGKAQQIATFPPFTPETTVPEMASSNGSVSARPALDPTAIGKVAVVDMHLHPGKFGRIPTSTRKFIVSSTPSFVQLYAPGALTPALDAWAPFVGVKGQTEFAGVAHALLFAVYTQKTSGFFPNEDLEAILTDPRNVAADGLPWAWGLASVNFFDGYVKADGTVDAALSKARLDALASYFEKRRDRFVGIKLAHPHQQIAFDDPRYLGVYDVAAKYGVPVYLHTGFSPFDQAKNERPYYDPEGLRNTIQNLPKVKFVLGHVGQGDALAVDHCLALAQQFPNVYLEISALNRPILRDVDGHDVPPDTTKPQYPYVLSEVKRRGLVDKTIFGSDGPQYAGMVKSYVGLMQDAMKTAGFTDAEIAKVMAKNFFAVFFGAG